MACQRCHRKKVKCTEGDPLRNVACRHCRSARSECAFPKRQKNVQVSEDYLKALENAATQGSTTSSAGPANLPMPMRCTQSETMPVCVSPPPRRRFVKNTTGDSFIIHLAVLATDGHRTASDGVTCLDGAYQQSTASGIGAHEYIPLRADEPAQTSTVTLPPYPYAIYLLSRFEEFMGFEYHWYLRRSFHDRLESTYCHPESAHSRDTTWIARLLVVLALGETYNSRHAPIIQLGDEHARNESTSAQQPPGLTLFEQTIAIFKAPFEEATIEHVETLNLIAVYCYALGRQKSAFIYSGLATRIASSLMLEGLTVRSTMTELDLEHRKRVWWTTYQLDAMTGSELGLNATFDFEEIEVQLGMPSDHDIIRAGHQDEFVSSDVMIAQIRLSTIRAKVLSVASSNLSGTDMEHTEKLLRSSITLLEQWKEDLPHDWGSACSTGISEQIIATPECRSLASLHLRYNQCFVLLLRPVLLMFLRFVLRDDVLEIDWPAYKVFSDRCIDHAQRNLHTLIDLKRIDKMANFGFWESLHLSSSLNVFMVARIVNMVRPYSLIYDDLEYEGTFQNAKNLLRQMSSLGNLNSRGHLRHLESLEQAYNLILDRVNSDSIGLLEMPNVATDLDQWLASLDPI